MSGLVVGFLVGVLLRVLVGEVDDMDMAAHCLLLRQSRKQKLLVTEQAAPP